MAKNSYKIRTGLDRTMLDAELNLSVQGISKMFPVKIILFWVGSIIFLFWAVTQTFIAKAGVGYIIGFVIMWLIATGFFGTYSKTKEMNWQKVPAFLQYFPKKNRKVLTRRSVDPSGFYNIVQIKSIDDNGLIVWADGTVGQAYNVAGSASVLLFEEDKRAILDRVDKFFRKLEPGPEIIWITTKSPKRVYTQLANLDQTNVLLKNRDPELLELLEEQFVILKDYVGGAFPSIHQYCFLKAANLEELRKVNSLLQAETSSSSLMFKQVNMMLGADVQGLLKVIYGSGETL